MTITDIAALPPADAEQQHLVDEIIHEADYAAIHSKAFAERCEHPVPLIVRVCTMPEEAGR